MRILILVIGSLHVLSLSASAQDLSLYAGMATTKMTDLKALQSLVAQQAPVQLQFTESFPAFWQFGLKMNWRTSEKLNAGFKIFATSTGARSSYEDYSGKIVDDYTLRCYGLGPNLEYLFLKKDKFELSGYFSAGYLITLFNWHTYITAGGTTSDSNDDFRSKGIMTELGVQIRKRYNELFFEASVGYQANAPGELINTKDDSKIYVGHNATADWSGARLSLGIGYRLGKRSPAASPEN